MYSMGHRYALSLDLWEVQFSRTIIHVLYATWSMIQYVALYFTILLVASGPNLSSGGVGSGRIWNVLHYS